MAERVVVRGRRGTLVLSMNRRVAAQELDELTARLRHPSTRVLMLEGGHVEAYIPPAPRRARQAGPRPRWAR
jgi:hypothetical protein